MLGRLNMSDEQCKETFRTYAESIFQRHRRRYGVFGPLITSKYSEESIIQATKHVVGSFDPNPESQKWKRNMFAAPAERCRWYIDISKHEQFSNACIVELLPTPSDLVPSMC